MGHRSRSLLPDVEPICLSMESDGSRDSGRPGLSWISDAIEMNDISPASAASPRGVRSHGAQRADCDAGNLGQNLVLRGSPNAFEADTGSFGRSRSNTTINLSSDAFGIRFRP